MIPIDEAEKIEGFPVRATIRRWAEAGLIRAEQHARGSRLAWRVCPDSIRAKLAGQDTEKADYAKLYRQWMTEQANGYHSGRAVGQRALEGSEYGMTCYWDVLKMKPCISAITPEYLKEALCALPPNYEEKRCYFSKREKIYKAVCSFTQFLIRQGLKTQVDLLEARKLKPKRIFPPKKTVLTEQALKRMMRLNEGYKSNRKEVDAVLTQTIIALACYAGLRSGEIRALELSHVRLSDGEIDVIDGKGHKNGTIGIAPALAKQLHEWLEVRPKTRAKTFLVAKTGKPLDARGLGRRIERIAAKANVKVSPHGLRRTFATVNVARGVPLPIIQKTLRHSDIKTTMAYVMVDERAAIEYMKAQKPKGRP